MKKHSSVGRGVPMTSLGERLTHLIKTTGLTKTELAERLRLSPSFISRICTGEKTPSDRTIYSICREFNVSERWLRSGDGEMFTECACNSMKERFRMVRKTLGLSQEDFAAKIGLTRGAITNAELGRSEPKDSLIVAVCNTYGVSEEWLRTGEGEMFVSHTREEEIASIMGTMLSSLPEEYVARLIKAICCLDDDDLLVLERVAIALADTKKKD